MNAAFHPPIQIDKLRNIPGHWSNTNAEIRNIQAQIDMLREARRGAAHAYERDEIEARRIQLRNQLRIERRALYLRQQPASPSIFRRLVAALFSR
jgi:hypothetical protein